MRLHHKMIWAAVIGFVCAIGLVLGAAYQQGKFDVEADPTLLFATPYAEGKVD